MHRTRATTVILTSPSPTKRPKRSNPRRFNTRCASFVSPFFPPISFLGRSCERTLTGCQVLIHVFAIGSHLLLLLCDTLCVRLCLPPAARVPSDGYCAVRPGLAWLCVIKWLVLRFAGTDLLRGFVLCCNRDTTSFWVFCIA